VIWYTKKRFPSGKFARDDVLERILGDLGAMNNSTKEVIDLSEEWGEL